MGGGARKRLRKTSIFETAIVARPLMATAFQILPWLLAIAFGIALAVVLWKQSRRPPEFSPEQNLLIRDLLNKEVERVAQERQTLIDKAAAEGKTVSTEAVLKPLEQLRFQYQAANRPEDVAVVDRMIGDFRAKYGTAIPVDEADKLLREIEARLASE